MSIVTEQIEISKAVGNGRTVRAQRGQEWVATNLNLTQIRNSAKISDLVNGYWSGAGNLGAGRTEHMYPDNREFWDNGVVNSDENGQEEIGFSQQADRTDWKFRDTQSETGLPPSG